MTKKQKLEKLELKLKESDKLFLEELYEGIIKNVTWFDEELVDVKILKKLLDEKMKEYDNKNEYKFQLDDSGWPTQVKKQLPKNTLLLKDVLIALIYTIFEMNKEIERQKYLNTLEDINKDE
jgi:hypothetical protein